MGKYKKELLFTLAVLAAAAGLWLATHAGRSTGNVAVVRYGDPRWSSASTYPKNADYDIDTGTYTVHLHVENGGIAFVNSPLHRPPVRGVRHFAKTPVTGRPACPPAPASP